MITRSTLQVRIDADGPRNRTETRRLARAREQEKNAFHTDT